jgi:preprotein translocase subunit SecG
MRLRFAARRAALAGVVASSVLLTSVLLISAPASAGSGGGAGVSGSGDEVISSILAAKGKGGATRRSGRAPTCHWQALTDEQVLYLVHVQASRPGLLASGFGNAIDEYLRSQVVEQATAPSTTAGTGATEVFDGHSERVFGSATVRNFDLRVRICNGVAETMQVAASPVISGDLARSLAAVRRVAVLPGPKVSVAPSDVALVGEPVFLDVKRPDPVRTSISLAGSTVEVAAAPRSPITVFDGQFAADVGRTINCDFDSGFDPNSELSPREQAERPGACVLHYDLTTGDQGEGRPPRIHQWVGYAAVEWHVEYRITRDGAAAHSGDMNGLFSFTLFGLSVEEVESVLEG